MTECKRCGQCCQNNGLIPPLVPGVDGGDHVPVLTWLQDVVDGLRERLADSPDIVENGHCIMYASGGCLVYEGRPDVCRHFQCWSMGQEDNITGDNPDGH